MIWLVVYGIGFVVTWIAVTGWVYAWAQGGSEVVSPEGMREDRTVSIVLGLMVGIVWPAGVWIIMWLFYGRDSGWKFPYV